MIEGKKKTTTQQSKAVLCSRTKMCPVVSRYHLQHTQKNITAEVAAE